MAMQAGQRYRCANPSCGCEIEVTHGTSWDQGSNLAPRCCCGRNMTLEAKVL